MRSSCYRAGLIVLLVGVLTGCAGSSAPDPSKGLTVEQMKAHLPKNTKIRVAQR